MIKTKKIKYSWSEYLALAYLRFYCQVTKQEILKSLPRYLLGPFTFFVSYGIVRSKRGCILLYCHGYWCWQWMPVRCHFHHVVLMLYMREQFQDQLISLEHRGPRTYSVYYSYQMTRSCCLYTFICLTRLYYKVQNGSAYVLQKWWADFWDWQIYILLQNKQLKKTLIIFFLHMASTLIVHRRQSPLQACIPLNSSLHSFSTHCRFY